MSNTDDIAAPLPPLQKILQSYPYLQYSDDANIQAFFDAYNALTQSYLQWFNSTPLGVYTNPAINGPLLDWVAQGLYGITRPVFATTTSLYLAGVNSDAVDTIPVDGFVYSSSGTAIVATDDFYKRYLTWFLYLGDGRYFNTHVLRMKVARFLFGVNGTDVTLSQAQAVSITESGMTLTITIPPSTAATYFQQAFESGILAFPFQLSATIVIT